MSLTPHQILALRELEEVWPDRAMVIIGATALSVTVQSTKKFDHSAWL